MANRNWRSSGYQSYNQILTPMSYYQQPVSYPAERKTYGGRGGYREDNNYKRERKDFQSNRRERFSPSKRRSPYQRSHESHGNFRKDSKKSYGHYEVKAPRLTFDIKELSASSLKFRYPKMYTPSDFFHTRLNVQEAFPLYRPMTLGNHCEFQVLNKDVEIDEQKDNELEPEDIDYKYSAKVMLMTTQTLPDLLKSTCHLPSSGTSAGQSKFGVYKNIQFLVGAKSKNEPMAIGGPWSPSLDGPDPDKDPSVLVKTAIRTCKALTGIDLSHCKKWYKFLDIHYYRPSERKVQNENDAEKKEEEKAEIEDEPTVEVVSIFIPDVWSCVPSDEEWTKIKAKFDQKLQSILHPEAAEQMIVEESKVENEEKVEEVKPDVTKEVTEEKNMNTTSADLDLNQMKVTELRVELAARGLDIKGLKSVLVQRLQEAIDNDKNSIGDQPNVVNEVKETPPEPESSILEEKVEEVIKVEMPKVESTNQLPEKEQKRLEKLYKLNDTPSILVHPNKNAKGGRFECALMSLESLLEYRIDDQKEHTFEVSLFIEQFNEMMQRDAAFVIYKALIDMPELAKESTEPEAKKPRVELDSNVRKSRLITDINLLFAFCVFDADNVGYLRDHDLENILHCIGLNLSRSQVKKLIAKMPSKKGSVIYRGVVERDVIEGGVEDVATLRTGAPNVDRLIELSYGNKAFFDEVDTPSLASRGGSLSLLDHLNAVNSRMAAVNVQVTMLNDELSKVKTCQSGAADVEGHLRDSIRKIDEKLAVEKQCHEKLAAVTRVYGALLKNARDHMDESVKGITEQFDEERLEAERAKQEADRVRAEAVVKAREEAEAVVKAREEAEKVAAAEVVVDGAPVVDNVEESEDIAEKV